MKNGIDYGKWRVNASHGELDGRLFLPIITPQAVKLQAFCYCPVHLPHSSRQAKSDLYDKNLSLICDQQSMIWCEGYELYNGHAQTIL